MREFIQTAVNGGKITRAKNNSDELLSIGKNIGSNYFLTNRQLGVVYNPGFSELNSASANQNLPPTCPPDSLSERDTGVEPVSFPWEGNIEPIN